MLLTKEQQAMLAGGQGQSVQKAMQILSALGKIYGAEALLPIRSVQISGVSYDNLGEAGLEWLADMAAGGGKARVLATLNPAGMDVENWQRMGIAESFAEKQMRVLDAFQSMGVNTTCSCTPYLFGNLPTFGEHIAWAESSAVCFANSVIGARSNREGGPSALAAALTGFTPAYGFHLDQNRLPNITVAVEISPTGTHQFGALGKAIGEALQAGGKKFVPYITGIEQASLEELKSFCASIATYGGAALFHMHGITPEAASLKAPAETITIAAAKVAAALATCINAEPAEAVDFVSLGCPHLSLNEIRLIAEKLAGRTVTKPFWITTSRPVKQMAAAMGYVQTIEAAGAIFATDTCCVVAPIQGRFKVLATDSAKACYYAIARNGFKTRLLPFDAVIEEALR